MWLTIGDSVKKFVLAVTLMSLAACSPTKNIKTGMYAKLPSQKPQITVDSVEEIGKLKPQINPPIKIAVAQPTGDKEWSSEEIHEIESWLPELKAAGLASDLVVIPRSLQNGCFYITSDCPRTAAAQLQADAVITIGQSVVTDKYLNPLSFLNITLIGMWVAPGHHRDSYAIYEAALIDTKNGYIYGIARGEGEVNKIRPYMYADYDTGQSEASLQALKSLGKQIVEKANGFLKNK